MASVLASITQAPYVLERERELPDHEQTVFMLQPLDGLQYLDVMAGGFHNYRLALNLGLKGWSNYKDENKQNVPFSIEAFNGMASEDLLELSCEITDRTVLREAQKKT
ncbi:MAG: hypothetical protein OEY11_15210 [Gammaproteobacteria bacterium]|nr:hypothetical protein [Gammaproteobacteria bacterium]